MKKTWSVPITENIEPSPFYSFTVIGGGKFANGAITAAFGYLFNQAVSKNRDTYDPNTGKSLIYRQEERLMPTTSPPELRWSGEIDWDKATTVPIGTIMEVITRRRWPELNIELGGVEKGYYYYKFRVHTIEVEYTMVRDEVVGSKIVGPLQPTQRFEWDRNRVDSRVETRTRSRSCTVGQSCSQ